MSNVENEVVSMEFDNEAFEKGVQSTLAMIEMLKDSLEFEGVKDGFSSIEAAAQNVNLQSIADNVDTIRDRFSAMGAVAFTVLQDITRGALSFAQQVGSAVLNPILEGGRQRALNIEQAKFQFRALGLSVEDSMASALDAVRGTAFGLDEAAKVAGSFGAAGLQAGEQMTTALRGVAGLASLAGTSFSDIGSVFQDIAAQQVLSLQDLRRFQDRGLDVITPLARQLGVTTNELRRMASDGEISFQQFAAAMSDAFGDQATKANETYTGSLANMRAALSRIGADIQAPKLEAMRQVFNATTPVIDKLHEKMKPLLVSFALLENLSAQKIVGFLDSLRFTGLENVFENIAKIVRNLRRAIMSFVDPIRKAFTDIFPPVTITNINKIAGQIKHFTRELRLSSESAHRVRQIFRGVFAAFKLGFDVVKGVVSVVVTVIRSLFSMLGGGQGNFLKFAGSIGMMVYRFQQMVESGQGISEFFKSVRNSITAFFDSIKGVTVLDTFRNAIVAVKDAIDNLFGGEGGSGGKSMGDSFGGKFLEPFDKLGKSFERLVKTSDTLGAAWTWLKTTASSLWNGIKDIFSGVGDISSLIVDGLKNGFTGENFDRILELINTGFLGALVIMFRRFVNNQGSFLDRITESTNTAVESLGETLSAFQKKLKAEALLEIAKAIALLVASIIALTFVDPKDIATSLGAMAIASGELVAVFYALNRIAATNDSADRMETMAQSMRTLAMALAIMVIPVKLLGELGLWNLAKGLGAVGVILLQFATFAHLMEGASADLQSLAFAMGILGASMYVMGKAVKQLGNIGLWNLVKGIGAIGVVILGLGLVMERFPPPANLAEIAVGLGLTGLAMMIIGRAIQQFADISIGDLVKGIASIGLSLLVVGTAMKSFPENMPAIGFALLMISFAMDKIADAVGAMGGMQLGELAKGIGAMALSLGLIAIAANVMTGALSGAFAIGVVAASLLIMAAAIKVFNSIPFDELLGGLAKLSLALIVIGAVSLLGGVTGATAAIAALGLALMPLAGAFAIFGAGAYLAAAAFVAFGTVSGPAVDNAMAAIRKLLALLPFAARMLAQALLAFFQEFVAAVPEFNAQFALLAEQILEAITKIAPLVGEALIVVIDTILRVLDEQAGPIIEAGAGLLIQFLQGVKENIYQISRIGGEIIIRFIEGLNQKAEGIANAILTLLQVILTTIGSYAGMVAQAAVGLIVSLINGIRSQVQPIILAAVNLIVSFVNGLRNNIHRIITAGVRFVEGILEGIAKAASRLARKAIEIVIDFATDLRNAVDDNADRIGQAGKHLIGAFINGITGGLASRVADAFSGVFDGVQDAWNNRPKMPWESGRPLLGDSGFIIDGLDVAADQVDAVTVQMVEAFVGVRDSIAAALENLDTYNPTVSPVLDLSGVETEARRLGGILDKNAVLAGVSLDRASQLSVDLNRQNGSDSLDVSGNGPAEITFQQIINAPKQLSTSDIYRNTRTQIQFAKEELKVP